MGSGDTVMKSGIGRNRIAQQEGVIAFEMEGAGIWEHLPCLVIKGVCDYADSHKNKKWQDYAAATAASTAKALVLTLFTPAVTTTEIAARWTRSAPKKWMVPFPPDPEFVERPDISEWLQEKSRIPGACVALVGLGGTGKSQLAVQYAYRVRNDSHVFWLNATSRSTLEESYRDMARVLRVETQNGTANDDDNVRRLGSWLKDEENGRWTIVLDNFDDYSIIGNDPDRVSTLLPQTSNGFTLITSRYSGAAERLVGSLKNIYNVTAMSENVALKLLRAKLKDRCGDEEGREVVRLLDCLPLALTQAAAYINRRSPRVTVGEYADMLRSKDTKEMLLSWERDDVRRGSISVFGTWIVTLEQIQKERPSAVDLLSLMSFFNPQSILGTPLRAWFMFDPAQLPCLTLRDTLPDRAPARFLPMSRKLRRQMHKRVPKDYAVKIWSRWVGTDLTKGGRPVTMRTMSAQAAVKAFRSTKAVTKLLRPRKSSGSDDSSVVTNELFQEDLDTLIGYSLVMPTTDRDVFKMHPLVRDCTRTWLVRTKSFDFWKRRSMLAAAMTVDSFKADGQVQSGLTAHFDPLIEESPQDNLELKLWFLLALPVLCRKVPLALSVLCQKISFLEYLARSWKDLGEYSRMLAISICQNTRT